MLETLSNPNARRGLHGAPPTSAGPGGPVMRRSTPLCLALAAFALAACRAAAGDLSPGAVSKGDDPGAAERSSPPVRRSSYLTNRRRPRLIAGKS